MKPQLFVALDVPNISQATKIVSSIWPLPCGFKVGLELMTHPEGPSFAARLATQGHPLFIDMKLGDIPTTVERAVANIAKLGATYATIQGKDMPMMQAAMRGCSGTKLKLLATTVLSSDNPESIRQQSHNVSAKTLTERRAYMARRCNMHGIIVSGENLNHIRELHGNRLLYATPGIRRPEDQTDDQHHVLTPEDAIRQGSDIVIVGRPITGASNPGMEAEKFLIRSGLIS
ncbi:MAG: orotidine-5'-phosphate decarboxylase [Alphaproteobacteria bacterium]